jgi:hypothetical protein
MKRNDLNLGTRLCEIFGLDPNYVGTMILRVGPPGWDVSLEVQIFAKSEQLELLVSEMKAFKLCPA